MAFRLRKIVKSILPMRRWGYYLGWLLIEGITSNYTTRVPKRSSQSTSRKSSRYTEDESISQNLSAVTNSLNASGKWREKENAVISSKINEKQPDLASVVMANTTIAADPCWFHGSLFSDQLVFLIDIDTKFKWPKFYQCHLRAESERSRNWGQNILEIWKACATPYR